MAKPMIDWSIRITRFTLEDPRTLKANEKNWRTHPPKQKEMLIGVLDEIGIIAPVIMSDVTKTMVDGHLRVDLAIERGQNKIPVVWTDLDEKEVEVALATYDPITMMAAANKMIHDDLLAGIQVKNETVKTFLDEMKTPQIVDNFIEGTENKGVRARPGKLVLVNIGSFVGRSGEEEVIDISDRLVAKFGDDDQENRIDDFLNWLADKIAEEDGELSDDAE